MTVNQYVYHLIVMIASMIFLAVLIITGHDSSPLLNTLLTGVIGGTGGAGIGQLLATFFKGPSDPSAPAVTTTSKVGGFITLRLLACMLIACVAISLAACATLSGSSSNTVVPTSCASAAAAVKSLTVFEQAGYVTAADASAINNALTVINPICEAPTQPTYAQATLDALSAAVSSLTAVQAKYNAAPTGQ